MQVVVVGAGPAGTAAALRASELGAEVVVVEADRLGGTCVNHGCVPTRVLARTARMAREARTAATWGVDAGPVTVDWDRVRARVRGDRATRACSWSRSCGRSASR